MRNKITEERIKCKFGDIYDYSKLNYIDINSKITIICPEHGEFQIFPRNYLKSKVGCPKCAHKIKGMNKIKKNSKVFVIKAKDVHKNKYDYSKVEYKGAHNKVCIICPEHGEFWQTPSAHLYGQGCPTCAKIKAKESQIKNTDWFLKQAKIVHGDRYDYSKSNYKGSFEKIEIICPVHGSFWQTSASHLSGCGCPKCKNKSQSELFTRLKCVFFKEHIEYEASPKWLNGQFFDIYFPKYNVAIEYNGIQHYEPRDQFGGINEYHKTIERDRLKIQKCKDNNCKLFILKYDYCQKDFIKLINDINIVILSYS